MLSHHHARCHIKDDRWDRCASFGLPNMTIILCAPRAEAIAPIQNKIGAYLADATLRCILTNPQKPLQIRRIMDEGNILIVKWLIDGAPSQPFSAVTTRPDNLALGYRLTSTRRSFKTVVFSLLAIIGWPLPCSSKGGTWRLGNLATPKVFRNCRTASHAQEGMKSFPRAGCGKSACPVVRPVKASMFSRGTVLPG